MQAMRSQRIIRFAHQQFSRGHYRTNMPRWFTATEPYEVQFDMGYEPWFIAPRQSTPLYDVNFRGYGRNKQQQVSNRCVAVLCDEHCVPQQCSELC